MLKKNYKNSSIKIPQGIGFDIIDVEKKTSFNFDFVLAGLVILLSLFGVLMIYSATRYSMPLGVSDPMYFFKRQGFWLIGAVVAFGVLQFFNYRILSKFWWVFYILIIILLVLVMIFGFEVHGSRRWINLGFFNAQFSEISKVLMVLVIASILSKWPREKVNAVGFKKVSLSLLAALTSIVLVALEPDHGTALIFFLTYMGMLFISGANMLYFFGILSGAVGGFFLMLSTGIIKQYQLDRLLIFFKPDVEIQGIGYNLYQSKLAIGSGGLWGKGLFQGEHTNLSYVPEHHTDFIFSVIGEETGFFGAIFVIVIFGLIIWRCFYIAANAKNSFGSLIAAGIGFIILSQTVINIGMTIGIMPVIGLPLPFLSYGGSNLLSVFIGAALVENVYFKRDLRKSHEVAYEEFD